MQAYYNVLTTLKAQLEADEFVNTVTQGDIFDVDLNKQTLFPLSHITVNDTRKKKNVLEFSVTLLCMDIVDKSKDETTDIFRGNDNEQDVLNTQLAVGLRLMEVLERGDFKQFQMRGEPSFEPFTERFENYMAGWAVTFTVVVPNTMLSCDAVVLPSACKEVNYLVEYANGTLIESGTIPSGGSKTITVPDCPTIEDATWTLKDADGNVLNTGTIASGASADITAPSVTYTNTDATYSGSVLSGGALSIPDSQINVNSVDRGDVVSVKTIDVNLSDSGGAVTPDSVTVTGNTVDIVVPAPVIPTPIGAQVPKTGSTVSYVTGDDGDLQRGREVDWLTLPANNPYGDTDRFKDELGGTAYANDIVIDWSTYNGSNTVLGYYRIPLTTASWATQVGNCAALSVGTFTSGWAMANWDEFENIHSKGTTLVAGRFDALNYTPFNINLGNYLWTSTSRDASFAIAYLLNPFGSFGVGLLNKTNSYQSIAAREFTVTGTTLT